MLLENAYGNDIELLDAFTGALAEGSNLSTTAIVGDLLQVPTCTDAVREGVKRQVLIDGERSNCVFSVRK